MDAFRKHALRNAFTSALPGATSTGFDLNPNHLRREIPALLLTLTLPRISEHMATAVVTTIHAAEGAAMAIGSKLLDLSVDLSAVAAQDCPPVAHYRIALRERVWLRELLTASGAEIAAGAPLASFSTDPNEALAGVPARAVRITLVGIVDPTEWWGGRR